MKKINKKLMIIITISILIFSTNPAGLVVADFEPQWATETQLIGLSNPNNMVRR